jgi:hypothetical protein
MAFIKREMNETMAAMKRKKEQRETDTTYSDAAGLFRQRSGSGEDVTGV